MPRQSAADASSDGQDLGGTGHSHHPPSCHAGGWETAMKMSTFLSNSAGIILLCSVPLYRRACKVSLNIEIYRDK